MTVLIVTIVTTDIFDSRLLASERVTKKERTYSLSDSLLSLWLNKKMNYPLITSPLPKNSILKVCFRG